MKLEAVGNLSIVTVIMQRLGNGWGVIENGKKGCDSKHVLDTGWRLWWLTEGDDED